MFKAIFRKIKNRVYMFVHRKKNSKTKDKDTAKNQIGSSLFQQAAAAIEKIRKEEGAFSYMR